MNKKIKKLLIIALIVMSVVIVGFFYATYLAQREPPNYCGSWGPWSGGSPTCNCDGTIKKRGGPSGPADDSGGHYECVGIIISDSE